MRDVRRRWMPLLFVAVGLWLAGAGPAGATELEGKSWTAGAYILSSNYDNDSTLSDSIGFGARGAYLFTPKLGLEFAIDFASADDSTKGSDETYDVTKYTINYLHNLKVRNPESKLSPFLLFGIGTMAYDGKGDSDSSTVIQAGGGLRLFLTERFGMRFDGRVWHFHGDSVIIPRDGFFAFDFTVGVTYAFGGGGGS